MMDVAVLPEMCLVRAERPVVVITDLDGTLLDHDTYSFAEASQALDLLRERSIPLVLCSSKTRAEIELLRRDLQIQHPFISENGGALFLPRGYFDFPLPEACPVAVYEALEFGVPYSELVFALHQTAGRLGVRVLGFSDSSVEEVANECGLSRLEAGLAKRREYDEPFRVLDSDPGARGRLFRALHRTGLTCTRGGRYYHLTGVTDKGRAIRTLMALYERAWGSVLAVGLGDSLNDLSLLEVVDVPIIVQNPAAGAAARLLRKVPRARLTGAPGPRGWNEAILELFGERAVAS